MTVKSCTQVQNQKENKQQATSVIKYTKHKNEVLIPRTLHTADRLISALQNVTSLIVTGHLLLRFNETYAVQLT
jgi:hypothetical protein